VILCATDDKHRSTLWRGGFADFCRSEPPLDRYGDWVPFSGRQRQYQPAFGEM